MDSGFAAARHPGTTNIDRRMTTPLPPTLGLVLAGGLARRMGGGDKARIEIGGVSILDRVLAVLSAQCVRIIINANGDPKRFADTGCTVVADNVPGHPGPLAGILAGLDWLATQDNGVEWMVSAPGDCPFLPDDLVEKLHQARRQKGTGVPLACARSGDWRHPTIGLWPLALREDLRKAVVDEQLRKIEVWTARHSVAIADWPVEPIDPFFNVNTPEDTERAARIALQNASN
jgi:molybdopterin-guanine dinucleotide biosynthesis protein A